ncbi:hypothetical protein MSMTP_1185 [Methanosarcina sp. MTP4]|nr:hypothetical protein MSMTP_1185 [Methanosarcina sp. MTP4]
MGQNDGPEVFPFGIRRIRSNVRTVKVPVAKLGEDFKGRFFYFGFGDDCRDVNFSFSGLSGFCQVLSFFAFLKAGFR